MTTLEYHTIDKSSWGDGPWQAEPDKRQWTDEATSLPCLAVRANLGHWCGYVGVPPSHPWHGTEYGDEATSAIRVHGGLTFSAGCADISEEAWRKAKSHLPRARAEAVRYPVGDSARWLATWKPVLESYPAWKEKMQAVKICHIATEPDNVWWFGFDCAHARDQIPGLQLNVGLLYREHEEYRTLEYVTSQCAQLAAQLAEPNR